jgi:aminoglycoside phosphotransferase (APT) family kinase protein
VLLRLYQRDPVQAGKEAVLNRLVASRVPVAPFLYFGEDNPATGHPYAVMEWVDGERLETVMASLDDEALSTLGNCLGRTLRSVHSFIFDKPGFFGAALHVSEPIDLGRDGLLAYLRHCLVKGPGGQRLGQELTSELLAFVEREGRLLDNWPGAPCLVHADFNGSNVLVRQRTEGAGREIAAVLDWEFAFSGSPAVDFGNLLRPPLDTVRGFAEAVASGYRQAGGMLPVEWRRIAQVADLFAWADFLNRPEAGAALIEDAREVIRGIIADHSMDPVGRAIERR